MHLDVANVTVDSFLVERRRFIKRRGTSAEITIFFRNTFFCNWKLVAKKLTSNLLLVGKRDGALARVIYPASEQLSKPHWRECQILADHLWSLFVRDYLPILEPRLKWHCAVALFTVAGVVMIHESKEAFASCQVFIVFPGTDGMVWSAEI